MKADVKKYRILLVIHALGYGGAGKMIVKLADALAQNEEYEVILYVEEKAGKHYPMDERVKIVQETKFFSNYLTRHFQEMFQLRRRVKEINPDLVISFQTNQNALSVYATRGRNIPVIISERGDPYVYHNLVAKIKTWVINMAEGGVFQTHKAMEYYGKGLQSRSKVIYNPCPTDVVERPMWKGRRNEISYVARFDIQQKRQDIMVEAFAKVVEMHPEMNLVFYGQGEPDMTEIKGLVKKMGIEKSVRFEGLVTDVIERIKDSKMFVLSSDHEGLPNSLIEAMIAGLPCVSTDCSPGGARELIEDGVNGLIVPVADPQKLADAILNLLDNPEKADKMGAEAQNLSKRLAPDVVFGQWKEYVDSYLKKA